MRKRIKAKSWVSGLRNWEGGGVCDWLLGSSRFGERLESAFGPLKVSSPLDVQIEMSRKRLDV